jgi:hypothetical protein
MRTRRPRPASAPRSAFAGFRFPPDVIVAVRWYLRFGLSYRDVEELLAERGVQVGHATNYRWGSGSRHCWPTPLGLRHAVSDRWQAPVMPPYPSSGRRCNREYSLGLLSAQVRNSGRMAAGFRSTSPIPSRAT